MLSYQEAGDQPFEKFLFESDLNIWDFKQYNKYVGFDK